MIKSFDQLLNGEPTSTVTPMEGDVVEQIIQEVLSRLQQNPVNSEDSEPEPETTQEESEPDNE